MHETDALLLESWIRERNAEAFKTLAKRYAGMVYGTCKRILSNSADAEDAAQECFEILATTEKPVGEYLAPWLHRAACNKALTRLRSERRRMERETQFAADLETAREIDWNDIYGIVDEAIAELPDKSRIPVVAHFLDDQTHAAIAQTLGIPRRTVTDRIDQGVEQLRKALTNRGVAISAVALAGLIKANAAEAAPATLITSLGKLALSGTKPVAGTAAVTAAAKTAAGFWTTKTVLATVASLMVAVGAVAGYWTLHDMKPFGRVTAPLVSLQQAAKNTQADTPPAGPGVPHAGVPGKEEAVAADTFPAAEELGAISGRVYNVATGRGIPFSTVTAKGPSGEIEVNTSLDGGYAITGLVPGRYDLSALAPFGFMNERNSCEKFAEVSPGAKIDRLDFQRSMGVSASGFVRDQAGRPVAGVSVSAWGLGPAGPGPGITDQTKGDGAFRLAGLYPNQKELSFSVQAEGMVASSQKKYSVGTDDLEGVEIVLEPKASISGRLVDGAGGPVADIKVCAWAKSPGGSPMIAQSTTNEQGEFDIFPLEGGDYYLVTMPPGQETRIGNTLDEVKVKPGEDVGELVLVYNPKLRIAGRVVDPDGNPLANKTVNCTGPALARAHTGKDGRFELAGLPEGFYTLFADKMVVKKNFVPDGAKIDIVLEATRKVQCRVVNGVSGLPVPRFQAHAFPGRSYGNTFGDRVMPHVFDADGRYWMDLAPGDYQMGVRAPGYRMALKNIQVNNAAETPAEVEIALEPGQLEVLVADALGNPVADAGIYLYAPVQSKLLRKVEDEIRFNARDPRDVPLGKTDANGLFHTDGLPLDDGFVYVNHPDYTPASAPLSLDQPIAVCLRPAVSVQGVVTVDGEPRPESVYLRLSYPDHPELGSLQANADEDGRFHFDRVRPGTALIRAQAYWAMDGSPNALQWSDPEGAQECRIPEAGAKDVALRIPNGTCSLAGSVTLDGLPFGQFAVEVVTRTADNMTVRQTAHTDAEGGFRMEHVSAGEAVVSVQSFFTHTMVPDAPLAVSILPDQDNRVEFAFTAKDLQ